MSTPQPTSVTEKSTPPADLLSTKRMLRAFTGSFISGTMALLCYKLLTEIATTFANKPITSTNVTAVNLSAAVRTLVLGMIALGAGVFGMAAIGLLLLGFQMIWQRVIRAGATAIDSPES
ncbi:MAG: DUF3082 domain-containing protein [Leptolyngbya sp. SIO1D8]|nr:DUF3082 domain-containing protein [Leptolyngbya sp. SIO1D8]